MKRESPKLAFLTPPIIIVISIFGYIIDFFIQLPFLIAFKMDDYIDNRKYKRMKKEERLNKY